MYVFHGVSSGARRAYHSNEAMRDDTLKVMLELSAPGGSAEGCMRRLQSVEYFLEDIDPTTYEPTFQVGYVRLRQRCKSGDASPSFASFPGSLSTPAPNPATSSTRTQLTQRPTSTTSSRASSAGAGRSFAAPSSTSTRLSRAASRRSHSVSPPSDR